MQKPIRVLYFGSHCMGKNDIVSLMQRSLARVPEVEVEPFDPCLYGKRPERFVNKQGQVNWIKDETVDDLVTRYDPNLVVCCAGGLSPTSSMHRRLADMGVPRVGIALSDPDDFAARSRCFANLFDVFYTNTRQSIPDYDGIGVQAKLLPFAADTHFHRPLDTPKKCDVVVVGMWRRDRVEMVRALRDKGLKVHCYGTYWRGRVMHRLGLSPHVQDEKQVRAINSGTVYLSFAATMAGHTNVKVGQFEAAACGTCILVQDFEELHLYFEPGREVITYATEAEAVEKACHLCKNPGEARRVGQAALERVKAEHTWDLRWQQVLADVQRIARSPQDHVVGRIE